MTCGNDEGGEPGPGRTQGRPAAAAARRLTIGKHSGSLPLLLTSPRTAAAAQETGPDDLAAELNPRKTQLNPHKAVPGG